MYQALKSNATQDQLILQNQIRQLEVLLQDKPKAAEVPLKEELPVTEPVPVRIFSRLNDAPPSKLT